MKMLKILLIGKRILYIADLSAVILLIALSIILACFIRIPAGSFIDPRSGIVVIDAGHGGIDGGANRNGILEKDINLSVARKVKEILERKGYLVVMTRAEDVSLDNLNRSSRSRHTRDLNARVNIINRSDAQLFISIHVNSNTKRPSESGSMVFFSKKYAQSRELALLIQQALNGITVNGANRVAHDPQLGRYFILNYSKVPGVIVETAFLTNAAEQKLLTQDEFLSQLASAIAAGVCRYLR